MAKMSPEYEAEFDRRSREGREYLKERMQLTAEWRAAEERRRRRRERRHRRLLFFLPSARRS